MQLKEEETNFQSDPAATGGEVDGGGPALGDRCCDEVTAAIAT